MLKQSVPSGLKFFHVELNGGMLTPGGTNLHGSGRRWCGRCTLRARLVLALAGQLGGVASTAEWVKVEPQDVVIWFLKTKDPNTMGLKMF